MWKKDKTDYGNRKGKKFTKNALGGEGKNHEKERIFFKRKKGFEKIWRIIRNKKMHREKKENFLVCFFYLIGRVDLISCRSFLGKDQERSCFYALYNYW